MDKVITAKLSTASVIRSVLTDLGALAIVYFLPTISHLIAFPMYLLDPMRIVIFASIIFSGSKVNSYILAFTIPLFSYFVGGHPVFAKSVLIGLELLANVTLFWYLYKKGNNVFWATLLSIILAKVFYYAAKFFMISFGVLQMELISTSLLVQCAVAFMISGITYMVFKWTQR